MGGGTALDRINLKLMKKLVTIVLGQPPRDSSEYEDLLSVCFPNERFKVTTVIAEPLVAGKNRECHIESSDILIGFRSGANRIIAVKNCKSKYLISPSYIEGILDGITDCNRKNTYCLFGGGEWDEANAEQFGMYYTNIIRIPINCDLWLDCGLLAIAETLNKTRILDCEG